MAYRFEMYMRRGECERLQGYDIEQKHSFEILHIAYLACFSDGFISFLFV